MSYIIDRALEDQHSTEIKNILGNYFIQKREVDDLEKGTDFAIYYIKPFSVGIRLRRYNQFIKNDYKNEFTIRWSRPSGIKTEIHKIREGLVDHIFYGFLSPDAESVIQYFLADLKKFTDPKPEAIIPNFPPDSKFAVYKMTQLPNSFYLKKWRDNKYGVW